MLSVTGAEGKYTILSSLGATSFPSNPLFLMLQPVDARIIFGIVLALVFPLSPLRLKPVVACHYGRLDLK